MGMAPVHAQSANQSQPVNTDPTNPLTTLSFICSAGVDPRDAQQPAVSHQQDQDQENQKRGSDTGEKQPPPGFELKDPQSKATLVGMIETLENTQLRGQLEVETFIRRLDELGFIDIQRNPETLEKSIVNKDNFEIWYKNPQPPAQRNNESDNAYQERLNELKKINDEIEQKYRILDDQERKSEWQNAKQQIKALNKKKVEPKKNQGGQKEPGLLDKDYQESIKVAIDARELRRASRAVFFPTVGTIGILGGAAAAILGGAPLLTTAAVVAIPLVLSRVWIGKEIDRMTSLYDGVFKLPITQQAGLALSPQKMLLETLATYLHVQQLPPSVRWITWRPKSFFDLQPDPEPNNDACSALGPLLVASKNTIKFWENFAFNVPDLKNPHAVDPTRVSELRRNEFDNVLVDFKEPWIARIRQSLLKVPIGCERVVLFGAGAGLVGATGYFTTSGALAWLLRAAGSLF